MKTPDTLRQGVQKLLGSIIYACLPAEEGIRICAEQGIVLAIQSAFIDWPNGPNA